MASAVEEFDVIIIGAGLSGINSAYLLKSQMPDARYVILESRDTLGGTWAYWKYPGVRSDSSSSVFRFTWHSWPYHTDFADASLIQAYTEDAVRAQGIDTHIRFGQGVVGMHWSTEEQQWTVETGVSGGGIANGEKEKAPVYRARWIVHCGGYYSYDKAQQVVIPGLDSFGGTVSHPQFWTPADDKAVAGKRVVLVGSGATAVTMLPHLAAAASHVTMLQRSPSYVMSLPRRNDIAALLHRWLPRRLADCLDWYAHMLLEHLIVFFLLYCPRLGRRALRRLAIRQLPAGYPVDVHFKPRYSPFEQRLCLAPDGDFYRALNRPNCDVVTGTIDTITTNGIRLRHDGPSDDHVHPPEIEADVIITATGLHIQILKGGPPVVDGEPVDVSQRYVWRSCMVEGIPNFSLIIGYSTGTWIPGADVRFRTVLSVIRRMRKLGATAAIPTVDPAIRSSLVRLPALPIKAGYLIRARDRLPLSSDRYPWVNGLNWFYDAWYNLIGSPKDSVVYTTSGDVNKKA